MKYNITLINNLTKKEYVYNDVEDNTNDSIYFNFSIDTTCLIDGEYTLYLYTENNQLITTELVQIGDYVNKHSTSYNKNDKYVTYNG